jgi:hypothetical protein
MCGLGSGNMGATLQHKCRLPNTQMLLPRSSGTGDRSASLMGQAVAAAVMEAATCTVVNRLSPNDPLIAALSSSSHSSYFLVVLRSPRMHTCVWFLGWGTKSVLVLLSCEAIVAGLSAGLCLGYGGKRRSRSFRIANDYPAGSLVRGPLEVFLCGAGIPWSEKRSVMIR